MEAAESLNTIAYPVLGIFAVVINTLALVALFLTRPLTTSQRAFIVAFGVSDLIGGVIMFAKGVSETEIGGYKLCSVSRFLLHTNLFYEIFLLVGFSTHHAVVLNWPFIAYRLENTRMVAGIIATAGLLTVIPLAMLVVQCVDLLHFKHAATVIFIFIIIPFFVNTIASSFLISVICRKSLRMVEKGVAIQNQSQDDALKEARMARHLMQVKRFRRHVHLAVTALLIFTSCFVLSVPILLADILLFMQTNFRKEKQLFIEDIAMMVASIRVLTNPFLLSFRLKVVRKSLLHSLGCRPRKRKKMRSMPHEITLLKKTSMQQPSPKRPSAVFVPGTMAYPADGSVSSHDLSKRRRSQWPQYLQSQSSKPFGKLRNAWQVIEDSDMSMTLCTSDELRDIDCLHLESKPSFNILEHAASLRQWLGQWDRRKTADRTFSPSQRTSSVTSSVRRARSEPKNMCGHELPVPIESFCRSQSATMLTPSVGSLHQLSDTSSLDLMSRHQSPIPMATAPMFDLQLSFAVDETFAGLHYCPESALDANNVGASL